MIAIETKDLHKTYVGGHFWARKRNTALTGINLVVKKKEVYGLLGLNGAGKTTLMKILLGLIKPTKGTALVLGEPASSIGTRKKIAYLPEMPYFPRYLTPSEILDFYGKLYELPAKVRKARADNALRITGLFEKKKVMLKDFSKGMLQRVGIAQLLLNNCEVFFLDEPTYGLDPLATKEMRDIILSLKKKGKTIFLNTHQINEVRQICDRIGILHNGKMVKEEQIKNIKIPLEDYFVRTVAHGKKADK
jgi:ABC-2 type transport system ATP-binding protein